MSPDEYRTQRASRVPPEEIVYSSILAGFAFACVAFGTGNFGAAGAAGVVVHLLGMIWTRLGCLLRK